jgi:hypothetical protein
MVDIIARFDPKRVKMAPECEHLEDRSVNSCKHPSRHRRRIWMPAYGSPFAGLVQATGASQTGEGVTNDAAAVPHAHPNRIPIDVLP